jgi:hypothetical protein
MAIIESVGNIGRHIPRKNSMPVDIATDRDHSSITNRPVSNVHMSYSQSAQVSTDIAEKESSNQTTAAATDTQFSLPLPQPITPEDLGIPCAKFIVYLEMDRESRLYQSIVQFQKLSSKLHGLNEAHMVR